MHGLEDIEPGYNDKIGSYKTKYTPAIRYASSAANAVEN